MANDNRNNDAPDTLIGPELVDRLTLQLRAACLAALSSGQSLDIEAVLRTILQGHALRPPGKQEEQTITRDRTPTPAQDAATVGLPPTKDPPAPANANVTQDFHGEQKASSTLARSGQNAPASPPESFAGYEVLGLLGKGGMGVVYKARQRGLKRIVALKMIKRDDANETDLARFRIEAEAVAQLHHPNIVQVYEVGEDTGRPFLSMEYIDGGSLKEKLRGQPQPVQHAAQLVQLLAWAMSAAHRQGIVHRDLKPGNVMLQGRREGSTELRPDTTMLVEELYGAPKITDFGLAKRLEEDDGQTRSGSILGTPRYMAPEQAMGRVKEVGPLADQYALGAMLYEMLTGRPPLEGATVLETLEQVCTREPVPPSRLQPKVPRDLETICLKCLQKDPGKRYADCTSLAEDLRRFVAGDPILARPVSAPERLWRWCRRNPRVAALSASIVLLLFAILGGLAFFNVRLSEEQAQTKREKEEALAQRGVALSTLGDMVTNVQREVGKLRGQEDLRRKLFNVVIESLKRVSENPAAKISLKDSTLAAVHDGLGNMYEGLGDSAQAAQEYQLAADAYAEQAKRDPDNAKCRGNQAIALMGLGKMKLRLKGGADEVRRCFSEAAEVLQTVDQGRPSDKIAPRVVKGLRADALRWLGVMTMDVDPGQARDYYQTALGLRKEVAELSRIEALQFGGVSCAGLLASPLGQGPLLALGAPIAVSSRQIEDARGELAAWYIWVGGAEKKMHNFASTQEMYLQALGLSQELADAHPDNLAVMWTLATARERLGDLYLHTSRPELAAKQYAAAYRIFRDLVDRNPRHVSYQDDVSRILYSIALAAQRRGDQALAAEKFRASLAIREERARSRPELATLRNLMVSLARCDEVHRAVEIAQRVRKEHGKDLGSLIDVACCFAICSDIVAANKPTHDQSRLREEYAVQAVAALETAVALGYRDVVNLEMEPDLDAVRDRPAFKALLDKLNQSPAK